MHTRILIYTPVYTYLYIHINIPVYIHNYIYIYTYTYTYTRIYTHTPTPIYTYIYIYTNTRIYTNTYTYIHIYTHRSDAQSAERCLEQALSYDFSIRSHIYYRILYTYIYSIQGKYNEAITDLKALTTEISDLYTNNNNNNNNNTHNTHSSNSNNNIQYYNTMRISDEEYLNVYILLGYIYGRTKHRKETE